MSDACHSFREENVLLVATKIAEYGHACLESHAAPHNHDRR
jgi:hypothetical protein